MADDAKVALLETAIKEMAAKLIQHSSALSEHGAMIAAGEKIQEVLRHAVEHHKEWLPISTEGLHEMSCKNSRSVLINYFRIEGVSDEVAAEIIDTMILSKR
jgi:predicted RNA methylase